MKSRALAIGTTGPGVTFSRFAIALEQLGLEPRVDAPLPGQLAVVVERRVKRHVRVGDVMRDHRREELDVVAGVAAPAA